MQDRFLIIFMRLSMMYTQLVISNIKEELKDVRTITFSTESGGSISYKAGQYLTLAMKSGDHEIRRSYSIVSSPVLNEPLSICVKRIENGAFSRYLVDEAKVGDVVLSTGSGGFFTLSEDIDNYKQVFFFAGGSGIAPSIALIKTILHIHSAIKVVLIYSSRSDKETIYYEELKQLEELYPSSLHVEYLFSNMKQLSTARLHQLLLKKMLEQLAEESYDRIPFYICGPFAYMRMITYTLIEEHVPAANIRKENFNADKPVVFNEPPDKEARNINIQYATKSISFTSQYPDSILKSAQKQGILLPYSCEVGRCGNCAARCTRGKVWMSYNEVLTEKEVASGLVLTCTGFPVGGDVDLDIPKEAG